MSTNACVIGWPIKHSRSPLIHNHWLEQHGIGGRYTREAVEPETLDAFVARLRDGQFAGCNVTVPHKETVLALADEADAAARAIGAANTLWMESGVLHASNTDAYGFLANLDDGAPGWDSAGGSAFVLGAGGAARAILHALLERGFDTVHLANRTRSRAEELAAQSGPKVCVADWSDRNALCEGAGLIVNTTSLGMAGSPRLDIDLAAAKPETLVTDLVYAPLVTPLLEQAKAKGLATVDGLGMLLHQAVPGFEKWFGVRPAVTQELRALIVADLEQE